MARGASTFRQRDVTRAIKAAVAAGLDIARVEIDTEGRISIIAGKAGKSGDGDLDRELEEWEAARLGQD
jgi:hypothetical protein